LPLLHTLFQRSELSRQH